MKTHVIYHYADYDGLLSAAVCLHFMPDAVIHGWDYGKPVPEIPDDCETLYIVDLSVEGLMDDPRLIWIDHHKSAIDKWGMTEPGASYHGATVRRGFWIDGVAACRLCWQWFTHMGGESRPWSKEKGKLLYDDPSLFAFTQRNVQEPLVLTLAGEYDIWFEEGNPEWDKCVALQHGLRSNSNCQTPEGLLPLLDESTALEGLIRDGFTIERYQSEQNESILKYNSYVREWEGLRFLVLNSARGNSRSFPGTAERDDIDALCMWKYCGEDVTVSLYHKTGRKELDLSVIAVKYGGGGHRGACGFKMSLEDFSKVLA